MKKELKDSWRAGQTSTTSDMADPNKMDMSLEDIIRLGGAVKQANNGGGGHDKTKKKNRHPARTKSDGDVGPSTSAEDPAPLLSRALRTRMLSASSASSSAVVSNRIVVSNLAPTVTTADVEELFGSFGRIHLAAAHYDEAGQSLGTADVVFDAHAAASAAVAKYDGVPLDGRPMNIQLAVSPAAAQALPPAHRPSPAPQQPRFGVDNRFGGQVQKKKKVAGKSSFVKSVPSAEELNAEMDRYNDARASASTSAAMEF